MDIGKRLRELRDAKGLSQRDIETRIGLLRGYVSKTEGGGGLPSPAPPSPARRPSVYKIVTRTDAPPPSEIRLMMCGVSSGVHYGSENRCQRCQGFSPWAEQGSFVSPDIRSHAPPRGRVPLVPDRDRGTRMTYVTKSSQVLISTRLLRLAAARVHAAQGWGLRPAPPSCLPL